MLIAVSAMKHNQTNNNVINEIIVVLHMHCIVAALSPDSMSHDVEQTATNLVHSSVLESDFRNNLLPVC